MIQGNIISLVAESIVNIATPKNRKFRIRLYDTKEGSHMRIWEYWLCFWIPVDVIPITIRTAKVVRLRIKGMKQIGTLQVIDKTKLQIYKLFNLESI